MYEAKALAMYYCITPVHMGAGTGLGVVDSPIQRESHTSYPVFPGSGIKGALRDHLSTVDGKDGMIASAFGAEDPGEGAGALSFTDAALVAYPVRSLVGAFIYLCSPVSLARFGRQLDLAGIEHKWKVPDVESGQALTATKATWLKLKRTEEVSETEEVSADSFTFKARESEELRKIAESLSNYLFCSSGHTDGSGFFSKKIKSDLVMISDSDFEYFITSTTSVEAHVRIDDETGTAADGALFYIENLPPESILSGIVLASRERRKESQHNADKMLSWIREQISGHTIQFGGNATTGRGLVSVSIPDTVDGEGVGSGEGDIQ